ncbi:MAG: cupin domain-containing protein [Sphaerochaeta sp.]|nr:cupin domain-containing protein [uncultured Sphaerochaeta sp.]MDD3929642.1 cupin domain-containing protein [Sphaerochaeta sp.]NCC90593.1 cupin domain-containing protein [Spirochaetia bacterium]
MIKNFKSSEVLLFADQVQYQEGQVVSKTLAQDKHHSLTLFAFEQGEEISTHASGGDALVVALDGVGEVTIDGDKFLLKAGESILMPSSVPHAIFAPERFKMFLVVIF